MQNFPEFVEGIVPLEFAFVSSVGRYANQKLGAYIAINNSSSR